MEYPLTLDELVEEVSGAIAHAAGLTPQRPFTLALSGGSTPKKLYEAMARNTSFDWKQLELFFGDERSVPAAHRDSNYRMVRQALGGLKVRMHPMEAEQGHASIYEELVKGRVPAGPGGVPVFDLVLLGLGPDGHTASLFPDAPELELTSKLVAMTLQPHLGHRRMTFTLPLINAARRIWILAAGTGKADIVAQVKGIDGSLPIQRVRPVAGELRWWLDKAAAAKVSAAVF